jgi:hypothetical protein
LVGATKGLEPGCRIGRQPDSLTVIDVDNQHFAPLRREIAAGMHCPSVTQRMIGSIEAVGVRGIVRKISAQRQQIRENLPV